MKKIFVVFMLVGTLLSFNIYTEARDSKDRATNGIYTAENNNNTRIQIIYRYRRYYRPRYYRTYRYTTYRIRPYRTIYIPRIRTTYYRYRTVRYVPRYRTVRYRTIYIPRYRRVYRRY